MQANIANALMFGEGAQMRVLAAWQDVAEAVRTAAKNRSEKIQRELEIARDIGYPRQITENLQAEFDAIQMLFQSRAKANR
jgi:protein-tyrosine-phosphatase